jgi:Spy/CpxP family protein refolding chaperone
MQHRPVKALSDQQIADLRAGRGMGLALPAELNGYPGPMHVLEHAAALGLTPQQQERTRAMIDAMRAEAIPVGERLIEQETRLDRLFANREITPAALTAATADIGATQARLREAHLKYHLAMMEVLTPEQVAEYRRLRGYASSGPMQHHERRH